MNKKVQGNLYLISDTHFGQWFANWFFNRPFKDLQDMNRSIIKNWNSIVKEEDTVIVVGDFYSGSSKFLSRLLKALNGEKVLVKGNHDFKYRYKKLIEKSEIEVYSRLEFFYEDVKLILTHKAEPILEANTINIHGHYHRRIRPFAKNSNKYFNVCVEHNSYKPVPIEKILSHYYKGEKNLSLGDLIFQVQNRRAINNLFLLQT